MSSIAGYATPEGTRKFQMLHEGTEGIAPGHFRTTVDGLVLSSLGMGSYLGEADTPTDVDMERATCRSVESGAINVLDTAINYRYQNSERSFGRAIAELVKVGRVQRDELFVASKNGFLTPDAQAKMPFKEYFQKTFIDTEIVKPEDIAGGMHCMSPSYLDDQLNRSRENLGLQTLDLMYLHNAAESQIPEIGREAFLARLEEAFTFYEEARSENRVRYYGLATWNCFRLDPDQVDYLNIESIVEMARRIGGEGHGFRFIQLPYNLALSEALFKANQTVSGQPMSILSACQTLGIGVFTSVPLMQGHLLQQPRLPQFEGLDLPSQWCLQFARSTPGVLAPLVGHKQPEHVEENLRVATVPPVTPQQFQELFLTEKTR